MKKVVFILFAALAITSCRSKKTVSEESNRESDKASVKVERVVDTVYRDRVIEKVKPVYSEVIVEQPCDENGNLLPVNYNIGSGGSRFHVFSKEGKLYINQKLDSVESIKEKEYRSRWKQDSLELRHSLISEYAKEKEVVRYVYPWWWWLVMILGGLLGLLWIAEKFDVPARIRRLILKV